jgi:hypothetical protein
MLLRRLLLTLLGLAACSAQAEFKAGTAKIDISPPKLPVLVNGGMTSRYLDKMRTRVHARAIALSDGTTPVVLVVADSCMMGRALLDEAKAVAAAKTGIPAERMLISATHSHTAPSSMGCLGTDADPDYVPFLKAKLVEAIATAHAAMVPAKIGFAKADAAAFTALRQWIRRPDRVAEDPFGNFTVRANMHAGRNWDDVTGESGPEDPDLSLIALQTRSGKPLAVLANFSMHYFGDKDISADYFGLFSEGLQQRIDPQGEMLGIMSHGCSGDIYRVDYKIPEKERANPTIESYTQGLLDIAIKAYESIKYRDSLDIAMAEKRLRLKYRVPDKQRLEWAQRIITEMGERAAKTPTEVYAREQIFLHERQDTEIVVQALRLGDIGIATTPNETYAITGLKIKAASPLTNNMVIELANGGDGYIPPPEMHAWGGYNTWAARSAGLEVMAEPKITQAAISLLETVAKAPRRRPELGAGSATRTIAAMKPHVWWRLNEFSGPLTRDASGHQRHAIYEGGIAYGLEGPHSEAFCPGEVNRAPHLVQGRICQELSDLGSQYTLSLWIWNGMPLDARDITGWFYSRDHHHGLSAYGEHLGLDRQGRLIFLTGSTVTAIGKTSLPRWTWQHVAFVKDGQSVRLFLNGRLEIETTASEITIPSLFIGGRSDQDSSWEGRLDEVAIFTRALKKEEIQSLQVQEKGQL